jgi:manganese-dependent inorganic pyrophosphatase
VLLLLTDIMKEGSEMLVASDNVELIEEAYATKTIDGKVWLDGVLSRKKQVVPPLQDALA